MHHSRPKKSRLNHPENSIRPFRHHHGTRASTAAQPQPDIYRAVRHTDSGILNAVARALSVVCDARIVCTTATYTSIGHFDWLSHDVIDMILQALVQECRSPVSTAVSRAKNARSVLRFVASSKALRHSEALVNNINCAVLCIATATLTPRPITTTRLRGGLVDTHLHRKLLDVWGRSHLDLVLLLTALSTGCLNSCSNGVDCSFARKRCRKVINTIALSLPPSTWNHSISRTVHVLDKSDGVVHVGANRSTAIVCKNGRSRMITVRSDEGGVHGVTATTPPTVANWDIVTAAYSPMEDALVTVLADRRHVPSRAPPVAPGASNSFGRLVFHTSAGTHDGTKRDLHLETLVNDSVHALLQAEDPVQHGLPIFTVVLVACCDDQQFIVVLEPLSNPESSRCTTVVVVVVVDDHHPTGTCTAHPAGGDLWRSPLGAPLVVCDPIRRVVAMLLQCPQQSHDANGTSLAIFYVDHCDPGTMFGKIHSIGPQLHTAGDGTVTPMDLQFVPSLCHDGSVMSRDGSECVTHEDDEIDVLVALLNTPDDDDDDDRVDMVSTGSVASPKGHTSDSELDDGDSEWSQGYLMHPHMWLYRVNVRLGGQNNSLSVKWSRIVSLCLRHPSDESNVIHATISPSPNGAHAIIGVMRLFSGGRTHTVRQLAPARSEQWLVSLASSSAITALVGSGFDSASMTKMCSVEDIVELRKIQSSCASGGGSRGGSCGIVHVTRDWTPGPLCRLPSNEAARACRLAVTSGMSPNREPLPEFIVRLHWLVNGWLCEIPSGVLLLSRP
jgi:hypothetical protein